MLWEHLGGGFIWPCGGQLAGQGIFPDKNNEMLATKGHGVRVRVCVPCKSNI